MLVAFGEAGKILGVSIKTMRRYDKKGLIKAYRTAGNHRRYDKEALIEFRKTRVYKPAEKDKTGITAIYARVSSSKQKEDLQRQIEFLKGKAEADGFVAKIYSDIGSGLNDKRHSLRKLVKDALENRFDSVYMTYPDRLARFGTRIILDIFEINKIDTKFVHIEEEEPGKSEESFEQTLVRDVISLVTSFSGKLYRRRRGKNAAETPVVEEEIPVVG